MHNNPLVSIISPCYNGEKYVSRYLDSILEQSYSNIELILVDDGSADKTKEIVLSYQHSFSQKGYTLIYIYQNNGGQASAINQGLKIFKGEYLMWVDSDDILLVDNVKNKVEYLQEHSEYGFVLCKADVVEESAVDIPLYIMGRQKPEGEDRLFSDLIYENNVCFNPCIIMAKREAIISTIPARHIYESREGQNWQLMLPLAYKYECGYLDEVLCKIVSHNDSHSRTKRNYRQILDRYYGFEDLLIHVINDLPDMPNSEKQEWIEEIHVKYQKRIMVTAHENHDRKTEKIAQKALKMYHYDYKADQLYLLKMDIYNTKVGKLVYKIVHPLKERIKR
ncbi:MAG: glycosyltransferase family 2 protein, partial [Clostridia bacterium]|nr:glycosyltransferase family 2 protein [Clostridia bacterium]